MSEPTPIKNTDAEHDAHQLEEQLQAMQKFVARRFDEISMEINATSQLLDMAEEGAKERFDNVLGALHSISHLDDGNSSANSGAELEAAVVQSEDAANTILDATEEIAGLVERHLTDKENLDPDTRELLSHISHNLENILLACTFQDLIGQRIRSAMEQLRNVEDELTTTLTNMGIKLEDHLRQASYKTVLESKGETIAASQDDVDSLFS